MGGTLSAATLPTVMAYVADTTDNKSRGGGLGLMGAAMGMGMIFGPVLGGFLGEYNPALPFFVAGGLAFAVLLFAFVFLPESRTAEARAHARSQARRNSLKEVAGALRGPIGFVLIIAFLATFASANLEGTFALFSQEHLGFGETEMGLVFGVMGLVMALSQGLLVGRFINRWGEERMIQVGLISNAVGYILFLWTFNMASIVGVMAIMGVASASLNPSVNSLASKRTPPDQQGRTMGVVGAYNSLGRIFGPVVGGALFDALGYRSPYIFGSLLFLAIYLISIKLFAHQRSKQQGHQPHAAHALAEPAAAPAD